MIEQLLVGFSAALSWTNFLFCFAGVVLGTMVGVLPGVGPLVTISVLLPFTYGAGPMAGIIMLAGIYYGAQYGGSTTAILVNMPGEASSVVTAIDGYQMARRGKAGQALAIAAVASFVAGTLATLLVALFGLSLGRLALSFGPPEYAILLVLGICASIGLSRGPLLQSLGGICIGLLLACVGADVATGSPRLAFGLPELADGLGLVPVALGLYGVTEAIRVLSAPAGSVAEIDPNIPVRPRLSGAELRASVAPTLRGTAIGSVLGVLPGGGAAIASFAAYLVERRTGTRRELFGHGNPAGVAAPEAANNAAAQTSFVPLLALGIPANAVMALMLGALMIHGVVPGPQLADLQPTLFWGLIASMWVGNAILLVLNLPLVGLWVRLSRLPYRDLVHAVMICTCVGAFSVNTSGFEVALVALFALLGWFFLRTGIDPITIMLAFVLGAPLEESLRASLTMSHGDLSVFVTRPVSVTLLLLGGVCLLLLIRSRGRSPRDSQT